MPTDRQVRVASELERQRSEIAGEIHDELMPYLFAAAAALSGHRRTATMTPQLDDAARWIDQAREVARRILSDLDVPPSVVENPLVAARDFLHPIVEATSIGEPPLMHWEGLTTMHRVIGEETQAIAVYRIVTELVRNSLRHARAQNVWMEASIVDTKWLVTVRDDGIGLATTDRPSSATFGLKLIHRRATDAGLELRQPTTPVGTRFELTVSSS